MNNSDKKNFNNADKENFNPEEETVQITKEETVQITKEDLYNSLIDLNTGFDAPSIKHFSEKDFRTIMNRCKDNKVKIYGIESFTTDGEFIDCIVQEMYDNDDDNDLWYLEAFNHFKNKMTKIENKNNVKIIYTASFSIE